MSDTHQPLLSLAEQRDDTATSFTPCTFEEYLGQTALKQKLAMYVTACTMRQEPLDHVLLFGPPGLGKTTLAQVIAHQLGSNVRITSGPVLERSGDLVAILSNLSARDVLFIDEIHRMPLPVEEVLYSAMEQFCVDMIIGQGAGAQTIRLPLQPFTVIGATTRTGLISGPLQTRFGIIERLDYYAPGELAEIALQNARFVQVEMERDAAALIGQRARGTPRIVKRLFRRVRDFAQVHGLGRITRDVAAAALHFFGIDEDGLGKLDRDILRIMLTEFDGGPVGLETLAAVTGEDKDTLEQYCEPFLMRLGWLQKTSRGRSIPPRKQLELRRKLALEGGGEQKTLFE